MADRMPPPGLTVVIGAHPKGDMPKSNGRMPPPGMKDEPATGEGGKVSPEDAEVIRADEHCIDCKNYDPTSGDCAKVEGAFDPQDGCAEYYEAIGSDVPDDPSTDDDEESDAP